MIEVKMGIPVAIVADKVRDSEIISPAVAIQPLINRINNSIKEGMKDGTSTYRIDLYKNECDNFEKLVGGNYHYEYKHFYRTSVTNSTGQNIVYVFDFWPRGDRYKVE